MPSPLIRLMRGTRNGSTKGINAPDGGIPAEQMRAKPVRVETVTPLGLGIQWRLEVLLVQLLGGMVQEDLAVMVKDAYSRPTVRWTWGTLASLVPTTCSLPQDLSITYALERTWQPMKAVLIASALNPAQLNLRKVYRTGQAKAPPVHLSDSRKEGCLLDWLGAPHGASLEELLYKP
ncbi:hypothetical protein P7K49_030327 [Saguinus oedipus]|uniref:Uncharacterized protein n=1 Tax=Saguinus oedipus TaxID=9490 RepID=A0ABQ9U311_SAGOE|nr:hypothetical protein P7K49_030327 [Saguinus oedipus]